MKKVAIIGGGITGLSIAYYLKKEEIPFDIFEKTNRIGGVIRSEKQNDFLFERGPNTGVVSSLELAELLAELSGKIKIRYADEKSKKRLIWKNNKWEALPNGFASAIKTPLFSTKDKIKTATEFFRKKGNFEQETLAQTVKRRLGESILDYAIDPFVSGVYAGDPDQLITKYAFPKLYNLEDKYGSFIKGSIQLSKERSKDYKSKVNKKIFSFENGLQELPDALAQIIGKESIYLNTSEIQVKFIQPNDFLINNTHYSHIISTISPQNIAKTLKFISEDDFNSLKEMKYAKIIHVNVGFNHWDGINLDAFGGLIPTKEKKDILGILFMSSQFPERAPKNGVLFSVFMGGIKKPYLYDYSDLKIEQIIQKHFQELMDKKQFNPILFEINRYPAAIAQYGTESAKKLETISNIEKKFKGLSIKGSLQEGIGISDRVSQAYQTAQKIINE